jgi:hypothetical protein
LFIYQNPCSSLVNFALLQEVYYTRSGKTNTRAAIWPPLFLWVQLYGGYGTAKRSWVFMSTLLYQGNRYEVVVVARLLGKPIVSEKLVQAVPLL